MVYNIYSMCAARQSVDERRTRIYKSSRSSSVRSSITRCRKVCTEGIPFVRKIGRRTTSYYDSYNKNNNIDGHAAKWAKRQFQRWFSRRVKNRFVVI